MNLSILTLINIAIIALVVIVHHECLILISRILNRHEGRARRKVLFGVFGTLAAHSIEVWIFAIGFYLLVLSGNFGDIQGNASGQFVDCVYLSFSCFTTVGFGDVFPDGEIRFLAVLEALTGLVLITWSASFLYLQMQKHWHVE